MCRRQVATEYNAAPFSMYARSKCAFNHSMTACKACLAAPWEHLDDQKILSCLH